MTPQTTTARTALKWGLITGIALVIYSTLLYTLNQAANSGLSLVIYGLLIGGLVMGMREYRIANGNYMTYGEGIGLGALLSAVTGLLSSAFTVFYTSVIDPGFQERLNEQVRDQMEQQGKVSDEQIDQALEMSQRYQTPGLQFIFGILWMVFVGVILSLIVAAFIRRNKANPFE